MALWLCESGGLWLIHGMCSYTSYARLALIWSNLTIMSSSIARNFELIAKLI